MIKYSPHSPIRLRLGSFAEVARVVQTAKTWSLTTQPESDSGMTTMESDTSVTVTVTQTISKTETRWYFHVTRIIAPWSFTLNIASYCCQNTVDSHCCYTICSVYIAVSALSAVTAVRFFPCSRPHQRLTLFPLSASARFTK